MSSSDLPPLSMASILSSTISLVSNAIPGTAKALLTTEDGKKPSTPAIITQAALTIPKTVMGRLNGTSLNPQWSFPEEVVFNAMQVVATHSDTANASARLFLPRILDLQALACVEPIEPATATTWYDGGEVKGYWIGKPVDPAKDIVMLYIHGGSFIGGHPLQCCHALADLIRIMAKEKNLNARVFAVDYPLAPESPYPAGLDACVRATKWIIDTIGAKNLILLGDSAGGNLALATILKIRDSGSTQHLHKILGCVPISPYVDFLGPRRSANESTENINPFQVEKPSGSEAKKEDRWSAGADNLHLNAGRCAIRYYLGTKGLNWYSSTGGWPNPWDKSQWDSNWLCAWDTILGITGAESISSDSAGDLAVHGAELRLSPERLSPTSPPFTHRRSVSQSPSPLAVESTFRTGQRITIPEQYLTPTRYSSVGIPRSASNPMNIADSPDGSTDSPLRRRSLMQQSGSRIRSISTSSKSRSLSRSRKISSDETLITSKLTDEPVAESEFETDDDKNSASGSDHSSPNTAVSSVMTSPLVGRSVKPVKRFSSVADRMVFVKPNVQSGVPFPGLSTLKTPYYLNPELSNYDLERIYITFALSPYVSPSRAYTFDNLPAMLFVVGQGEAVYDDVMKCVDKARKSIISAERQLTAGEIAGRPRTFGRVDVMERPLGEHTYLLLPEALVRGKGMDGLRDIATWTDRMVKEKMEWPTRVHVFRATKASPALRLDTGKGKGASREHSQERYPVF